MTCAQFELQFQELVLVVASKLEWLKAIQTVFQYLVIPQSRIVEEAATFHIHQVFDLWFKIKFGLHRALVHQLEVFDRQLEAIFQNLRAFAKVIGFSLLNFQVMSLKLKILKLDASSIQIFIQASLEIC